MKRKASPRKPEVSSAAAGRQTVQERAYELYLKRGQQTGHDMEDWLQAERELGAQQNSHAKR